MGADPFSNSRNLSLTNQFVSNLQRGIYELFAIMHVAQEIIVSHKCDGLFKCILYRSWNKAVIFVTYPWCYK